MTPEEARDLLDGTTPGPWRVGGAPDEHPAVVKHRTVDGGPLIACDNIAQEIHNDADAALIAAAPVLAAMIAGMREEWGVEYAGVNHGGRHTEWGYETRDEAERQARRYRLCTDMHPVRTVRRYVTEQEEA